MCLIGTNRHTLDPLKGETNRKISQLSTKEKLQSMLRLSGCYRDFIPNLLSLVLTVTNLIRKNFSNISTCNLNASTALYNLKENNKKMSSTFKAPLTVPFDGTQMLPTTLSEHA